MKSYTCLCVRTKSRLSGITVSSMLTDPFLHVKEALLIECMGVVKVSRSVVSNPFQPHGL